ncbi:hypothetical protein M9H77_35791 [Catharanthus roseus]|uniref:Uncharacterized protein n=1 Tax=Catharanthus roseus TaxID=4058 RepID=A0ACB9ZR98_CATRO|nr:hypothetical protein M9H77_35791 [Catharanthus roseus]
MYDRMLNCKEHLSKSPCTQLDKNWIASFAVLRTPQYTLNTAVTAEGRRGEEEEKKRRKEREEHEKKRRERERRSRGGERKTEEATAVFGEEELKTTTARRYDQPRNRKSRTCQKQIMKYAEKDEYYLMPNDGLGILISLNKSDPRDGHSRLAKEAEVEEVLEDCVEPRCTEIDDSSSRLEFSSNHSWRIGRNTDAGLCSECCRETKTRMLDNWEFKTAKNYILLNARKLNLTFGNTNQKNNFVKEEKMHKRSPKGNLQRSKRSLKTTRFYEDEVIKLKTLKTIRMLRDSFNACFESEGKSVFYRKTSHPIFVEENQIFFSLEKSNVRILWIHIKIGHPIFKLDV